MLTLAATYRDRKEEKRRWLHFNWLFNIHNRHSSRPMPCFCRGLIHGLAADWLCRLSLDSGYLSIYINRQSGGFSSTECLQHDNQSFLLLASCRSSLSLSYKPLRHVVWTRSSPTQSCFCWHCASFCVRCRRIGPAASVPRRQSPFAAIAQANSPYISLANATHDAKCHTSDSWSLLWSTHFATERLVDRAPGVREYEFLMEWL